MPERLIMTAIEVEVCERCAKELRTYPLTLTESRRLCATVRHFAELLREADSLLLRENTTGACVFASLRDALAAYYGPPVSSQTPAGIRWRK